MSAILQLLKIPGIATIIPLVVKLLAAGKAKDWNLVVELIGKIITAMNPTPAPTPVPNPVFSAAEPSEDDLVAHAVACGCDEADARALVDSLK